MLGRRPPAAALHNYSPSTLFLFCPKQVQLLESLRAEEAKRGEALERELAALAQRQFRASQALHEAQVGEMGVAGL